MLKPIYIRNELLTESGLNWLKVDICTTYAGKDLESGVATDKLLKHQQIAWVDRNFYNLMDFFPEAEEPTSYRSAVGALYDHHAGKPVSATMHVDASNQALQLYAVLLSCKDTAMLCNLATGNIRQDAYTMIADELNLIYATNIFNRSNCKKALMTTLYGSTSQDEQLAKAIYKISDNPALVAEKVIELEERLNMSMSNPIKLKDAFNSVMNKIAPSAMAAMSAIQTLNTLNQEMYSWTLPDGFIVDYWVTKDVELESTVTIDGVPMTFNAVARDTYMKDPKSRAMAPNIIHSVDGWIVRELVKRLESWVSTTHDAFTCHVNDVDRLISIYKDLLVELLNSDLLNQIMTQIKGDNNIPFVAKANSLTEADIREAVYALY